MVLFCLLEFGMLLGVLLDVRTSVVVCVDKLPMVREWEWRGCIAWPM